VRTRAWHFIHYAGRGETLLFDMQQDPEQDDDVASEHPELVARFSDEIVAWRREMERNLPALEEPAS
jgi:hypothetical protein